jgi:hypothetical protein
MPQKKVFGRWGRKIMEFSFADTGEIPISMFTEKSFPSLFKKAVKGLSIIPPG